MVSKSWSTLRTVDRGRARFNWFELRFLPYPVTVMSAVLGTRGPWPNGLGTDGKYNHPLHKRVYLY